jgi:hypothetical protein
MSEQTLTDTALIELLRERAEGRRYGETRDLFNAAADRLEALSAPPREGEKPAEYFDTLDLAYRAVDALGGTGASPAYNSALDAALGAIETLGGMDAWERKRKGYPNASA